MTDQKNSWKLFQALLKVHVLGKNQPLLGADAAKFDFPYLMKLLDEHRLELICTPLLKSLLASDDIKQLTNRCLDLTQQHLQQVKSLLRLSHFFDAAHLRYIIIKGQPLNQQLYGSTCARRSSDIDILIMASDLNQANTTLKYAGFECTAIITPALWRDLPSYHCNLIKDFRYINKETNVVLELHIMVNLMDKHMRFFSNTDAILLGHKTLPILSLEDNFLYLCIHGAKHNWQRLQWLIDVALFSQKYALNWRKLCQLAKDYQRTRILVEVQLLLKSCFSIATVPIKAGWYEKAVIRLRIRGIKKRWRRVDPGNRRDKVKSMFLASLIYVTWQEKLRYLFLYVLSRKTAVQKLSTNPTISPWRLFLHAFVTTIFCKP